MCDREKRTIETVRENWTQVTVIILLLQRRRLQDVGLEAQPGNQNSVPDIARVVGRNFAGRKRVADDRFVVIWPSKLRAGVGRERSPGLTRLGRRKHVEVCLFQSE